jgi:hypothetical protein
MIACIAKTTQLADMGFSLTCQLYLAIDQHYTTFQLLQWTSWCDLALCWASHVSAIRSSSTNRIPYVTMHVSRAAPCTGGFWCPAHFVGL